jgi:hypothetical protein
MKLLFVHLWHLRFWRIFFEDLAFFRVFHFLFRKYSEFRNEANSRKIPAKISFLGVVVFEMIFEEILTRTHTRGHDIKTEENSSVLKKMKF